ncbi:hypothetical protein BDW22DRAFT_1354152 [Trametopsis cervina]|nr:hypothetical protein BDW22DRAFT_1354152 [Trametopsis cervina]
MAETTQEETSRRLSEASSGFDALFANDLDKARQIFSTNASAFHLLGTGVCAFLEAALGMEQGLMAQATQVLAESEAGAKKQLKAAKSLPSSTRYPAATEWELLQTDATILHALTLALNESYMGYVQCFYELNSAHSKFTKLFKTVFPSGVDDYATPATSQATSPAPSIRSETSSTNTAKQQARSGYGVFGSIGRFGGSLLSAQPVANPVASLPEGPIEELIMSGTAFGYVLFNLVFSLLPAGVRGVVGFLGFKHDRRLALKALAVSANQKDVHSTFASLVLMTYYGVVLLLTGYQADESHILKQYRAIIDQVEPRFPTGSLWILNRAKLLRMSYDANGAIDTLKNGLTMDRPKSFQQADGLIIFELAWTLLSQRRYEESAEWFLKMTEVNSWSHATYYFIAASCYLSIGNAEKAQKLFDDIPTLIEGKKIGGKDLPTEVLIKKKIAFYKEKQKRWSKSEDNFVKAIRISPAEELGLFWNTHVRIGKDVAQAHIDELTAFSPPVTISSPLIKTQPAPTSQGPPDLDTADELAVRSLILGIVHRTAGEFKAAREFLEDAHRRHKTVTINTWVGGVTCYEMAILDLKEADAKYGSGSTFDPSALPIGDEAKAAWRKVLKDAGEKVDLAASLSPQSIDMSSRLDTRISLLRDELATKREMVDRA